MPIPDNPADAIQTTFGRLTTQMATRVVGHDDLVKHLYTCLLCGGHALIEGLPGLGKTLTVKTFSQVLNLSFARIQFTPDLMPADILGTNIVNQDERGGRFFEFYKGPIFNQVILADEINRASPKTQSALLEAMQEHNVTLYGKTYRLDPPFIVLATQNPIEMEGTYPLPEAQIDRFFFKLKVGYPDSDQMSRIIDKTTLGKTPPPEAVLDAESILELKNVATQVPLAEHVKSYAVNLVMASHPHSSGAIDIIRKYVRFGASPRGVQSLVMAAKIWALLHGRYHTAREDIRAVAKPALRHRIMLNLRGAAEGIDPDTIVEELVGNTDGKS